MPVERGNEAMPIRAATLAAPLMVALAGGGCESLQREVSSDAGDSYEFINSRRDP
jgi:hypothetical protein